MTITYTNEVRTNVIDPLRSLIYTEFKPVDVEFAANFNPGRMTRGEYMRIWLNDSTEVLKHSDGETREYNISITFYFDTVRHSTKRAWDDVYSDKAEHLKRLLDNYNYYDDGTYRWHNLIIEVGPVMSVEELEEIEDETTMAIKCELVITRSNFR